MARIKRDPKTVALAQQIIDTYNPQSAQDMDEALKDIFGPLFFVDSLHSSMDIFSFLQIK